MFLENITKDTTHGAEETRFDNLRKAEGENVFLKCADAFFMYI